MQPAAIARLHLGSLTLADPLEDAKRLAGQDPSAILDRGHPQEITVDIQLHPGHALVVVEAGDAGFAFTWASLVASRIFDAIQDVDPMAELEVALVPDRFAAPPSGLRVGLLLVMEGDEDPEPVIEETLTSLGFNLQAVEIAANDIGLIQIAAVGLAEDLDVLFVVGPSAEVSEALSPLLPTTLSDLESALRRYRPSGRFIHDYDRPIAGVRSPCVVAQLPLDPSHFEGVLAYGMPIILRAISPFPSKAL